MKIGDTIIEQGSSLSFEFFPPKTVADEDRLFDAVRALELFRPTFVSVTYGAGGGTLKNTRNTVKRLLEETTLAVMPHLTCINQGAGELKDILRDYQRLGVENVLALRGDPPREAAPAAAGGGPCYARDLVRLVRDTGDFSLRGAR